MSPLQAQRTTLGTSPYPPRQTPTNASSAFTPINQYQTTTAPMTEHVADMSDENSKISGGRMLSPSLRDQAPFSDTFVINSTRKEHNSQVSDSSTVTTDDRQSKLTISWDANDLESENDDEPPVKRKRVSRKRTSIRQTNNDTPVSGEKGTQRQTISRTSELELGGVDDRGHLIGVYSQGFQNSEMEVFAKRLENGTIEFQAYPEGSRVAIDLDGVARIKLDDAVLDGMDNNDDLSPTTKHERIKQYLSTKSVKPLARNLVSYSMSRDVTEYKPADMELEVGHLKSVPSVRTCCL
jgi:hypothetical protein